MTPTASLFCSVFLWLPSAPAAVQGSAQEQPPPPARPLEAIAAIVDAFRTHQLVALGDAHGNEQAQAS